LILYAREAFALKGPSGFFFWHVPSTNWPWYGPQNPEGLRREIFSYILKLSKVQWKLGKYPKRGVTFHFSLIHYDCWLICKKTKHNLHQHFVY
jgi:hypothetical protein